MSKIEIGDWVRIRSEVTAEMLRDHGILARSGAIKDAAKLQVVESWPEGLLIADPDPQWHQWWLPWNWVEATSPDDT